MTPVLEISRCELLLIHIDRRPLTMAGESLEHKVTSRLGDRVHAEAYVTGLLASALADLDASWAFDEYVLHRSALLLLQPWCAEGDANTEEQYSILEAWAAWDHVLEHLNPLAYAMLKLTTPSGLKIELDHLLRDLRRIVIERHREELLPHQLNLTLAVESMPLTSPRVLCVPVPSPRRGFALLFDANYCFVLYIVANTIAGVFDAAGLDFPEPGSEKEPNTFGRVGEVLRSHLADGQLGIAPRLATVVRRFVTGDKEVSSPASPPYSLTSPITQTSLLYGAHLFQLAREYSRILRSHTAATHILATHHTIGTADVMVLSSEVEDELDIDQFAMDITLAHIAKSTRSLEDPIYALVASGAGLSITVIRLLQEALELAGVPPLVRHPDTFGQEMLAIESTYFATTKAVNPYLNIVRTIAESLWTECRDEMDEAYQLTSDSDEEN